MNPLLNVLNALPGGALQGTTDASDTPNLLGSTFAQLLGQLNPAATVTTAEISEDTLTEELSGDAVATNDPALYALQPVTQGDAMVPALVERPPEVAGSEANLVTGLLAQMLAASAMQPQAQPTMTADSPTSGTAPLRGTSMAGAIPTPVAEKQDGNAHPATTNAVNTPTAPLTANATEAKDASRANIATPVGTAASHNTLPPAAMQAVAQAGDNPQTQAELLERAPLDRGISARERVTMRDTALPGTPQSALDLARQAPAPNDAVAFAQGLARSDHPPHGGSAAVPTAGHIPLPIGMDDMPSTAAASFARDTLTGATVAGPLGTNSRLRAFGYTDARERSDEFVIPGQATVATSLRGDVVTSLTIAPRMDTPEWQPAFARGVRLLVNDGTTAASLQLNPAEFGPIDVRIVITDRRADISFLVTNPNADAALQSALPELRDQLARSGIQLGQTSVGAQGQEHRQPADSPRREHAADASATPSAAPTLPTRPRTNSQIDTFA